MKRFTPVRRNPIFQPNQGDIIMGDRGNIKVVESFFNQEEERQGIYIYSHWGGAELPFRLQNALRKRWRWADVPYLTRIIFEEVIKGEEGTETGFGISLSLCDNSHLIVVVDTKNGGIVRFETEKGECIDSWSFERYILLTSKEIQAAFEG